MTRERLSTEDLLYANIHMIVEDLRDAWQDSLRKQYKTEAIKQLKSFLHSVEKYDPNAKSCTSYEYQPTVNNHRYLDIDFDAVNALLVTKRLDPTYAGGYDRNDPETAVLLKIGTSSLSSRYEVAQYLDAHRELLIINYDRAQKDADEFLDFAIARFKIRQTKKIMSAVSERSDLLLEDIAYNLTLSGSFVTGLIKVTMDNSDSFSLAVNTKYNCRYYPKYTPYVQYPTRYVDVKIGSAHFKTRSEAQMGAEFNVAS